MLKRGLIVSCQALEDEPLHSPFIMSRMALAAQEAGAVGIRANGVADIKAIQQQVKLPLIGIIKKDYDHLEAYITPTKAEVEALIACSIEVIALDATMSQSQEYLQSLKKLYPKQLFMADISTFEEGIRAIDLGFDYISTTLIGYTVQSQNLDKFEVLQQLINSSSIPIIAEGNFNTPDQAGKAYAMGCYAVVVGSAITRPQFIVKQFVEGLSR